MNPVIETFNKASSRYGQAGTSFFNYFGKALVDFAGSLSAAHVLDIGTGRGAVLFPLVDAVGPQGSVVGIDASADMLKHTHEDLREMGVKSASLIEMNAEGLDFPKESFDAVFFGFSLFFMKDAAQVLKSVGEILKPGGAVYISIWGETAPLTQWFVDWVKAASGDSSPLSQSKIKGGDGLVELLTAAEFNEIEIKDVFLDFAYESPKQWWESLWDQGTRCYMERLSEEQISSTREAALIKAYEMENAAGRLSDRFFAIFAKAKLGHKPKKDL